MYDMEDKPVKPRVLRDGSVVCGSCKEGIVYIEKVPNLYCAFMNKKLQEEFCPLCGRLVDWDEKL